MATQELYVRLESSLGDLSSSLNLLADSDRASIAKHVSTLDAIIRDSHCGQSAGAAEAGTGLDDEVGADGLFSLLFGVTGDGVAVVGDGVIVATNPVFAQMFGYAVDALPGVDPIELIEPVDRTVVREASLGVDGLCLVKARGLRKDGSEFAIEIRRWSDSRQTEQRGLVVVRDPSACRLGQSGDICHLEELAHAQRFSAIGEMASGLAHELNQPLAAIVNYTRGCIRRLRANDCGADHADILDVLEKVSQQGDRAGRVLRRIREFVRKREPQRTLVDLNDVVSVSVGMTTSEAADVGVTVAMDEAAVALLVEADQTQIEQVVLNLLRNGYDALREGVCPSRQLTVRSWVEGDCASVEVADNGPGLAPDTEERVFDPFFTTRSKGMGLGLAISRSIAEAHGGHLSARKMPSGGAAFCLSLPLERGEETHGH